MNVYRESFKIHSYEMDSQGRVSLQALCNYLQEIAGNHAQELGVSVQTLFKQNLTWVLSRLHVEINKYPFWKDAVVIETWPFGVEGKYALREFILQNREGSEIGRATTSWMLLDIVKRRPVTIPDFIKDLRPSEPRRALPDGFEKLPLPVDISLHKEFEVRLDDLDINNHVNNVSYIEWAVETIPKEIWQRKRVHRLEISYRAESRYGDRIVSQTQQLTHQGPICFLHRLSRDSDGKELAVVRTEWSDLV
jgi:medium-chain acyl-[acyl-carrier-protein] hydrolase